MAKLLRVHLDDTTVDIVTKNPVKYVDHISRTGVWVNANKFYPAIRIASIELIDDDKEESGN